jgi:hypothetical protein
VGGDTLVSDLRLRVIDTAKQRLCDAPDLSQAAALDRMKWGIDMALVAGNRIFSKDTDTISSYLGNSNCELTLYGLPKTPQARGSIELTGGASASLVAQSPLTSLPTAVPTPAGLPAPGVVPTSAEMTVMLQRMQSDKPFAKQVMDRAIADHDFAMMWVREVSTNPANMGLAMNLMQTNPDVMAATQKLMMNDPTGIMNGYAGTMAPPAQQTPARVRYAESLLELSSMGFTDEAASLQALEKAGGDLGAAIDFLTERS